MKITTRRKTLGERRTEETAQRRAEREAERAAAGYQPPQPTLRHGSYMVPRVWNFTERDDSAYSQEVARERVRTHLRVVFGPEFRLSDELTALLGDVAERITADRSPARWTVPVAESAAAMVNALSDIAAGLRAAPPRWPDRLTGESVADGSWAALLTETARTLDEPLSDALGRPDRVIGGQEVSDWLADHLRALGRAARTLDGYVSRVQRAESGTEDRAEPPTAEHLTVEALRARHAAERKALRERQSSEWAEFSAQMKAARTA